MKQAHVHQALDHVRHAKDPEFQLALCDVAIESVARLLPYEERRLAEITPLPSSLLTMLQTRKEEAAEQFVLRRPPLPLVPRGSACPAGRAAPAAAGLLGDSPPHAPGKAWESSADAGPRSCPCPGEEEREDRRRQSRMTVECFAFLLPGGTRATLENLASGGVFLRTDQLQPPGTPLRMIVSATFGPAQAQGVVRWLRTTAGEMGMGLEFTQLSPELLEYLETRLGCTISPALPTSVPAFR
ncbi:MAG TPA: PilZ domain-containing protein [Deferrisomatales bacterium]|nr:PilZ domain-containing protein [Deferrisomatales bacterium]